jgi:hypothetical protein
MSGGVPKYMAFQRSSEAKRPGFEFGIIAPQFRAVNREVWSGF